MLKESMEVQEEAVMGLLLCVLDVLHGNFPKLFGNVSGGAVIQLK